MIASAGSAPASPTPRPAPAKPAPAKPAPVKPALGKPTAKTEAVKSAASKPDPKSKTELAANTEPKSKAADTKAKSTKAEATAKTDSKTKTAAKKAEADGDAERIWVQVAGGANKDDLDKAWAKLKADKPDLFAGRTPQTFAANATNRLVVGPFKTGDEAQAYVNKLAKAGKPAFRVTTKKEQKVERVS